MMFRIDTVLWSANPYFLSDAAWGVMYVLHGLAGVGLITMVIAHVYFAIRPEKLWMTRSMIRGWITREEYLEHYDPARWAVTDTVAGSPSGAAAAPPRDAEPAAPA